MSHKEQFLQVWQTESPTTLRVLKAYPADKPEFRPHERSQTATQLAWNFVLARVFIQQVLDGTFTIPPNAPPPPEKWEQLISAYELQEKKLLERMSAIQDSDLLKTMNFLVAPGKMKDIPVIQFLWFVLCDGIHHRGQLAVYLRMAGGKVPSIYGPSADEPWM